MSRPPRPVAAPVLSRSNWIRLCVQGAIMTVGALAAYQIGDDRGGAVLAGTMLLTTLSFFHLFAAFLSRVSRTISDVAQGPRRCTPTGQAAGCPPKYLQTRGLRPGDTCIAGTLLRSADSLSALRGRPEFGHADCFRVTVRQARGGRLRRPSPP